MCCKRHVEIGNDPLRAGQNLVKLVGEVARVIVEDANPVELVNLVQLTEQLGQTRPAVEIDAVIRHVLGDQDQLADAVTGQLAGLVDHLLDGLGDVLAPHVGNRTEGTQAVASFGDLEVGEVAGRDPQPRAVVLGLHGRGAEERALLAQAHPGCGRIPGRFPPGRRRRPPGRLRETGRARASFCRSARQPATTTPLTVPARLRSSISSITPHDSCRAVSMNPQVLTMTRSASVPSGTSAKPSWARSPSIRSESTRFLEQPRLTKLTVALGA